MWSAKNLFFICKHSIYIKEREGKGVWEHFGSTQLEASSVFAVQTDCPGMRGPRIPQNSEGIRCSYVNVKKHESPGDQKCGAGRGYWESKGRPEYGT